MLFKKKKASFKPALIKTIIGKGSLFKGNISFTSGILIEGKIEGSIRADELDDNSLVVLHSSGVVEGDIHAVNVIIDGTVEGSVYCSNFSELNQNCRINGDLYYHVILMNAGASVNGKLSHNEDSTRLLEHLTDPKNKKPKN